MKHKNVAMLVFAAFVLVAIGFEIAPWLSNGNILQVEREATMAIASDKLSDHIAAQRTLQENAHRHEQQDNQVIHNLTNVQVNSVNDFVGRERESLVTELATGGKKIQLNGTYRHAVVLQRDEHGKIRKVEVGPSGIAHNE